jgi:hypothetical protein
MFCQQIMNYKRLINKDILNATVTRKTDYKKPYWNWSNNDIHIACITCFSCGNYIVSNLGENLPEQIRCICIVTGLRFMDFNFNIELDDDSIDFILDEIEYWSDF